MKLPLQKATLHEMPFVHFIVDAFEMYVENINSIMQRESNNICSSSHNSRSDLYYGTSLMVYIFNAFFIHAFNSLKYIIYTKWVLKFHFICIDQ